jgi:hypothetical protein
MAGNIEVGVRRLEVTRRRRRRRRTLVSPWGVLSFNSPASYLYRPLLRLGADETAVCFRDDKTDSSIFLLSRIHLRVGQWASCMRDYSCML